MITNLCVNPLIIKQTDSKQILKPKLRCVKNRKPRVNNNKPPASN